ncbi:3-phosphoserine/phosphohydroxythreonine transaminase [Capnocytophaga sputigena]|uniref:Phosphoserine aminotransferase n=1 Tax=Capnocytophaga sputigena TaxID=1019 RepID=A0AAX2I9Z4_CAPSP|nr:3-phosphoserine/phosphohydroxythreonine transaminase [Capnocytophaga sputigena]ATA83797.1 phosphoserine transaminase [Capnocytophaga sputigena]EEB66891.1 putative phosphoserine transaminase [Capnocytophaga sputigena ATCC 33612]PBN45805.1 phosphoserine transaminase [Capnocytophaga sputigena]SQA75262.1 Phosphoserine aminotransferase [Capnocytophaga sputigena]
MKKHNFSAGPSILAPEVFQKASQALLDFEGTGLSVIEVSHRSPEFVRVIERARALALEIAGLDDSYTTLFLQGGASMQFLMVPYNLLETKAAYIDTGTWANKAQKEAALFGNTEVIASSKADGYKYIPKNVTVPTDANYLHITTNNTIYGTEFHSLPQTDIPLVADMSSDIFSRPLDYKQFSLIYAGSQKNLGASGSTLVIVKKDILGKVSRKLPSMMDYQLHIKNDSMFNTPSTFAVYVNLLVLEWIQAQGGLQALGKRNQAKADLLYGEIDRNPLVVGYANKEDRSLMNVVFNLTDESTKERFDTLCKEANISGIKGHRSVGGYRASIYNALPLESVQVLVDVLKEFERTA